MQLDSMTRQEYEERRRRLDEELRAAQELLEASHRAQVRALDRLWTALTEGSAVPSTAPPAEKRERRPPLSLHDAIFRVLDRLPEVFTKDDVCEALGESPDRRALHRVLHNLILDGWLEIQDRGRARIPASYRRLASPESVQGGPHS